MSTFSVTHVVAASGHDVLVVTGEVDADTAHRLVDAVTERLRDGWTGTLRLDLGGVTFLDSSGISALVNLRRSLQRIGAAVVIVEKSQPVRRTLEMVGLARLFDERPEER